MIRSTMKPLTAMIACALLAACASGSRSPPPEVVRLQNDLARITGDTRIPPHAGPEIEEARRAVDALVVDGRRMETKPSITTSTRRSLDQVAEAEGLAGHAELRARSCRVSAKALLLEAGHAKPTWRRPAFGRTRRGDAARAMRVLARRCRHRTHAGGCCSSSSRPPRPPERTEASDRRGLVVTLASASKSTVPS